MLQVETDTIEATIRATVRPCRSSDLQALEWMGLYTPHRAIIRRAFEAQERGEALMLLAVSSGFPIAQVWVDFTRKDNVAYFWAVRTFFPLQGAGIGSRMIRAAERAARRRGCRRAELETEDDLTTFYERLGWRRAGERGEGRCLMAKDLKEL
ncbi:GNAT family N-acetyltransferase [Chelativorans sp. AA-79]|uniref:GNAT family N-acetyltransferase n=1 Tax=Chelativorans sp. AA-79 TaxID=3028735 RepID=UPI0023F89D11|nr:GNAT family N-acetyltransferase [Chelativorans sp. AA-79]WEX10410.1 GNAT family N-acetyltransferase [Chelativorans sp. AA-79]